MSWGDFTKKILFRFKEIGQDDIIAEFVKLWQISTMNDYLERFEVLQYLVLARQSHLSELYFVSSTLIGLKDDIKCSLQMFKLLIVAEVFILAGINEAYSSLNAQLSCGFGKLQNALPLLDLVNSPNTYASFSSPNKTPTP